MRETISDGAKLLLGEILGLQASYGVCEATDPHFENRIGGKWTTIQEYAAILAR